MILLVGAGPMAIDYAKVLITQKRQFTVVGRGKESALDFANATGHEVIEGGLPLFLSSNEQPIEAAIVSVSVEQLALATEQLIERGVRRILVEKPAGLTVEEVKAVAELANKYNTEIFVAYNRRFYSSVLAAQKIIEEDGGVDSFNFEVTEWAHVIEGVEKPSSVKENWFLCNSTHVVDLAFFLGGQPEKMSTYHAGGISWHTRSSSFSGAGCTSGGALFSYAGNWTAPGRWSVEMLTKNSRLILRPMEKLQVQKIGSVAIEEVAIDDQLDVDFKPGLFLQVKSFLDGELTGMCTIEEHLENTYNYVKMAGYNE